jgi:hypothetical protein
VHIPQADTIDVSGIQACTLANAGLLTATLIGCTVSALDLVALLSALFFKPVFIHIQLRGQHLCSAVYADSTGQRLIAAAVLRRRGR